MYQMKLVENSISIQQLGKIAKQKFGNLVKAVVDLDKKIMAIDAELHADQEAFLIKKGSKQKNLWGINLYPEKFGKSNFIEFFSMINLRPSQNNLGQNIKSKPTRQKIKKIVSQLITK